MTSIETVLGRYFKFLESKGKVFNIILGIAWTVFFGILDVITPSETSFSFLYLFPIAFVTWFAGKRSGFIISLMCVVFWSIRNPVGYSIILIWNILSTLAIFCTVSFMLSKIHMMWKMERELSRKDPLTGVMNIRAFYELVGYEISRHKREGSPFSVAYLDLDNFKTVNDNFGHKKGDELLKAVVLNIVGCLRKTDVVARVGGDEFTIFLPFTGSEDVQVVMKKVMGQLQKLTERGQLKVTFSIGVLTFTHCDIELDEIISRSDKLMYEVKNTTKNNICFDTMPSTRQ